MIDCCGVCAHSYVVEPEFGCEFYTCRLDKSKENDYYTPRCDKYKPDLDYIKFMGFDKEDE